MSVNINIKNHEKVFIDGYTGQRITDLKTKTPIYDNEDEVGNDTSNGGDEAGEVEETEA